MLAAFCYLHCLCFETLSVLQQPLYTHLHCVHATCYVVQAESALDLQQTYIVALEAQMRSMSRPTAASTTTSPSTATAASATATETTAGEDTSSSSDADRAAAAAAAESSEAAAAAAATAAENARAAEAESTALQQLSDRITELQRKHTCSICNSMLCCQ
jgi:hypothetical protein